MRNGLLPSMIFVVVALAFSLPAVAQVYFPQSGLGGPSPEAKAAAAAAPKPAYEPHDLSGIWSGGGGLLGGAPAPPMTAWGQEQFKVHKPSQHVDSAEGGYTIRGNDPLGNCDPEGYPRNMQRGSVEFVQTPTKIVQIFQNGLRIREIWTDGRKIPEDVDPRWYGWAVGHWEGDSLIVDSKGYDGRTWLNGGGLPHSEDMTLHEVFHHPDAMTLEVTMTLDDPKTYTKPWVGRTQTFHLLLPKDGMELKESYCVPSEEESFNESFPQTKQLPGGVPQQRP